MKSHFILQAIPKGLTWEQHNQLIENTTLQPLNKKYPIKISYQLNFLKRLLQQLEKHCDEVHDIVYESYCAVQQRVAKDTTEKYAYKHYVQPSLDVSITLRESKSFVAEGTTGLCSWQASIALADYLVQNIKLNIITVIYFTVKYLTGNARQSYANPFQI